MSSASVFDQMDNGLVFQAGKQCPAGDLPWKPHPAFKGVALKHLVTGKATEGRFSAHLIRIDPGREIGEHRHEGKLELHEVVEGQGVCRAMGGEIVYRPGVVALMPPGEPHSLKAGDQGLRLLVKFTPALL